MSMALIYLDKKDTKNASTALNKSVSHKDEAIKQLQTIFDNEGNLPNGMVEKARNSTNKHIMLIENILKSQKNTTDILRPIVEKLQNQQNKLSQIK